MIYNSVEKVQAYLDTLPVLKLHGLNDLAELRQAFNEQSAFDTNIQNKIELLYSSCLRSTYNIDGEMIEGARGRRSLGDLYRLAKSYYPEVSLDEILIDLGELTKVVGISTIICPDIHKRVYKLQVYIDSYFSDNYTDEFSIDLYPYFLRCKHQVFNYDKYLNYINL